ncbi:Putative niacin/nicotinamide transporter NaiP [Sporomusa carbonis]|uniref:MFS transporter n=1 Tax=Sporomusa carbonis TaxID=3076075 RepID=UPI003A604947
MSTITERLGNLPLGKFHWRLLLIMCLGWAFDAMDTGIVAFVLPKLMAAWKLTSAQVGMIGSVGLVGMAIGAMMGGTIADYVGRKKVFAATLILYSLGTGACGLAWNYEALLFFRFLVGFGLGGQLPVAITLMSEYSPTNYRGRMIVLLESSWAFGWLAASIISYLIIPKYGWEVAFYIGAVPALYVFYLWQMVPESAMYLMKKGRIEEAHALVSKVEQELGVPQGRKPSPAEMETAATAPAFSVFQLFNPTYLKRTACLWILWFCIVFSYYGIFLWLPTLLVKAGHNMVQSFEFVLWMTVAQIPGYFAAAALVDKIGRKATMATFLIGCAFAAYMFGNAASTAQIYLWGCLMSFFNLGAWGILYTYTPELYPTEARSTGVGWAAGFGRIGGIVAPMVVAAMITGPDKIPLVFMMFTAVLVIAALDMIVLGDETKQKALN